MAVEQNIRVNAGAAALGERLGELSRKLAALKKVWAKVIVDLAAFISRSMMGNVSPLSKTSMRFPPTIGASVCASMVGKKAASPSVIGGIC